MGSLEFISKIIESLAWPVVVIIIAKMFRKPIIELTKGINKLRFQDVEIDFSKQLEQIDNKINASSGLVIKAENIKPDGILDEVETLASFSPNSAVIMSWTLVEKELQDTIMRLNISADYPPYNSPLKNISILRENNFIDDKIEESINELRMIRNNILHKDSTKEKITALEAMGYHKLTQKAIAILKTLRNN